MFRISHSGVPNFDPYPVVWMICFEKPNLVYEICVNIMDGNGINININGVSHVGTFRIVIAYPTEFTFVYKLQATYVIPWVKNYLSWGWHFDG